MAYEVIARKWRPQQFADVIGQEHVARTLVNAIKSERVAHAYLFVGPRGIGKTTTARIFAKALNCKNGPTDTPCDKCDACLEIMQGSNLDVMEIDGASNNGVEQVRELCSNAAYVPARGPYKIYIIDEVHMLSMGAFNALLKTLEEPPAHAKFIFATTEPHKVPATILSRCQRFDLRPIETVKIVELLGKIAKAEGVEIDEDALLAIARGADGGMRDAESALDQLISFRGTKISEEDVMSVFGLASREVLEKMVSSILDNDIPAAISVVTQLDQAGKDLQRVVFELLQYFRNILIILCAGGSLDNLDLTQAQIATLKVQAEKTDPGRILRIVDILTKAVGSLRHAVSKRTLLEVAVIRCARAAATVTIDGLLKQIVALRDGLPAGASKVTSSSNSTETSVKEVASEKYGTPVSTPEPVRELPAEDEVDALKANWREIIAEVGKMAPLVKGYLVDSPRCKG